MFRIWQGNQKEYVTVSLLGEHFFKGVLFDSGSDVIVLFNGTDFIYIPVTHIEYITADTPETEIVEPINSLGNLSTYIQNGLIFHSILNEAKGIYQEINVLNKRSVHGTIVDVLKDYIVFYSPIYKRMYIAKKHIKWLIPYTSNERPYNLSESELDWKQAKQEFQEDFNNQLVTLLNKLVVLNLGEKVHHIGKLKSISNKMIELITVKEKSMYINIEHIQTIHEV